jgi:hypothetical protein
MSEQNLPEAARQFIVKWNRRALGEARADLAALLETVRAEEREACAALLETEADRRAGDDPALSSAWDDLLAEELRELAGRVRGGAETAPRWVRTTEEMPAEREEVLVWIVPDDDSPAYCYLARWNGSEWMDGAESIGNEWVQAWRPLPPGPPEGGEEP